MVDNVQSTMGSIELKKREAKNASRCIDAVLVSSAVSALASRRWAARCFEKPACQCSVLVLKDYYGVCRVASLAGRGGMVA